MALGPVTVHVSHPEFAEGELSTVVENPGRRDRAFELATVDLEEPGGVEGDVQDERGDPVPGARVAVGHAPSYLPAGALPRGVAVTDANGAFSLTGLASGPVTIDVFSPDRGRGSAKVDVQSNRTHSGLRITLRPSGSEQDPFAPGGVAVTLGERGSGDALEVVVVTVSENSEAARAGLQAGDVIAAINDAKPSNMHDARARLSGPLQSDVVLSVTRGGAGQRLVRHARAGSQIARGVGRSLRLGDEAERDGRVLRDFALQVARQRLAQSSLTSLPAASRG